MYKETVNEKFLKKLEMIERHVERKLSKNKGKKKKLSNLQRYRLNKLKSKLKE